MSLAHRKVSFDTLLEQVSRQGLSSVRSELLAELAKEVWYGERDLVPLLQREVTDKLHQRVEKQRALYLVDMLRRFPCVPEEKAAQLNSFVSSWSELKPKDHSAHATEMVAKYRLDKLAYEWGLEEDVSHHMQSMLKFQTRHYAATLEGVKSGYAEPDPSRAAARR